MTFQVESNGRAWMNMRKLGIGVVTAAVFVAGLWSGIGSAGWLGDSQAVGYTAKLGAAAEVPKPTGVAPGATGTFTAGLTRRGAGGTLAWKVTFRGLTGRATAAHIHVARPGTAGPVAVPLCVPCRSGARGTAKLKAATVTAVLRGRAYVNVHTARNPAGEIRGQIKKGGRPLAPTTTSTTTTTGTTTTEPPYPYP
jgi:CHRD domain